MSTQAPERSYRIGDVLRNCMHESRVERIVREWQRVYSRLLESNICH